MRRYAVVIEQGPTRYGTYVPDRRCLLARLLAHWHNREELPAGSRSAAMIGQDRILDLSERIARQFAPDRIILFGSYAYGTPDEGSDVDLLVVLPFEGKPYRKAAEITAAVHAGFPLDVVVQRPDDVEQRYREADPLVRDALNRGRVLYDRSARTG